MLGKETEITSLPDCTSDRPSSVKALTGISGQFFSSAHRYPVRPFMLIIGVFGEQSKYLGFCSFGIITAHEHRSSSCIQIIFCQSHGSAPSGSPCRLRMDTSPSIITGYAVLTILSIIASEIGLSLSGSELMRSYQPSVWYCVQKIIDRSMRASMISSRSYFRSELDSESATRQELADQPSCTP